jgi:poly(hydroxyalkanoate) depolymerase family esterase
VLGLLAVPQASAATGTFTRHTDTALPYWLYTPSSYTGAADVPLVVYLQGCNQSVPDAAQGSRWNALAEAKGFLVAYPEQQVGYYPAQTGNVARCWNFSSPLEWSRTGFEPSSIAAITQKVIADEAVDTARVYVTGVSAGGAMASNMAALFPELYSAAGVLLGCSFPCGDATGSGAYQAMAANARRMPVFNVIGVGDPAINAGVGEVTVMQWLSTNDFVDDGLLNASVSQTPAALEQHGFDQTPAPGTGDACIHPGTVYKLPCAAGVLGLPSYPYTVRKYNDSHGDLLDYWIIYGLSHGYPGGDPAASFTDPAGPDVTGAAYDFFMAHPR